MSSFAKSKTLKQQREFLPIYAVRQQVRDFFATEYFLGGGGGGGGGGGFHQRCVMYAVRKFC